MIISFMEYNRIEMEINRTALNDVNIEITKSNWFIVAVILIINITTKIIIYHLIVI